MMVFSSSSLRHRVRSEPPLQARSACAGSKHVLHRVVVERHSRQELDICAHAGGDLELFDDGVFGGVGGIDRDVDDDGAEANQRARVVQEVGHGL